MQLVTTIQNIKGKGIATLLGKVKEKDVIVKVQFADQAKNEHDIQQTLKSNDVQGFVEFLCFATCEGDKDYIESFALFNDASRLCKAKGVSMGVIIMPYYKNKSFEDFLKTYVKVDKEKISSRIVEKTIRSLFDAYDKTGFTHGDCFPKNVVLDHEYQPIIIDFEKSAFDSPNKVMRFWRDIDDFMGDVSRYVFHGKLDDICRGHVFMNLAMNQGPTEDNIRKLIDAVSELSS